jgi:hypothetical protein
MDFDHNGIVNFIDFAALAENWLGGTEINSKVGDFDGDGDVDFVDLQKFCEHWLETGCVQLYGCGRADLDNDTDVDFKDFAIFAQNWLAE